MKKNYLINALFILVYQFITAGNGIQSNPYTVVQAIAKTDGSAQTYWVKGYIVGEMSEFSNNKYFYELAPPFDGTTAYLIADKPDEIDLSKCMPVQLESARSDSMNLYDHPKYWRKEVLCCGLLRDYFALPGLKSLTSLSILTAAPLNNDAASWTFFEDMDGSYTASSSSSIFAGGKYVGQTGEWDLYGATWGDSGNDNKWGKASARLRLSEASTGNPGYLQMNFDKPNGAGVIRFWAGYYGTDNNGAVAIQTSKNQGLTWETVIASQFIAKDWKEYQLAINQTGNIRLRIIKAETGDAGINIDKIRVSDFDGTNGLPIITNNNISYFSANSVVYLRFSNPVKSAKLFTISGDLVWSASIASNTISLPLPKGIYLLKTPQSSHKIICR